MSTLAAFFPSRHAAFAAEPRRFFLLPGARFLRRLSIIAALALALLAGDSVVMSWRSAGAEIRHQLAQAAAELRSRGVVPRQSDEAALLRRFPEQRATIDTRLWPEVRVTLHGLDRAACSDAKALAGRIEGLVVVEIAPETAAADCRNVNDMSWRLLPWTQSAIARATRRRRKSAFVRGGSDCGSNRGSRTEQD